MRSIIMKKVVKFGGSSLANAEQFQKVGDIIRSEESRRYVVPSAPGKRFSADTKVTDLLYACYDKAEAGVFQIGTNRYIDKLVFKCGSFQPEPDLPYTFVMGKKLKKGPESYEDVREAVVKDYLTVYEDAWLKDLKQKYKVEINQEVLKTVNNNGSN